MKSLELKVYEILKQKHSEQEAQTIMEFANDKAEQKINEKKDTFLIKDDKVDLINTMKDDKVDLINTMRNDKVDLINTMKNDKVDLIKWMVGIWIAQMVAILGLYFKSH
jgi:hypothetical protein